MNTTKHLGKALSYIVYLTCITLGSVTLTAMCIGPAHAAGYINGNTLLQKCEAPKDSQHRDQCLHYLAGTLDAYNGLMFCTPAGITLGQAADMVVSTLKKLPEDRHSTSADSYIFWTFSKYECPKKAPSQAPSSSGTRLPPT